MTLLTPRRVVPALVLVGLAAGAPASSAAAAPACGDTITADTTLHADLGRCAGDGLVVGADGITLDLDGHAITGDGVSGGDDTGVRVDHHDGVAIRHGAITDFDHAVRLDGSSRNRIIHLVATHNGDADIGRAILLMDGSDGNRIERNDASHNGRSGVAILDSSRNVVIRNRLNDNGVAGMGVFGGTDNQVALNTVRDNGENGIFWGSGLSGGRVVSNVVSGSPGIGLVADDSTGALIAHNRLTGNADNLVVFGSGNVVHANVVAGATGCPDGCGYGISVEGGTGNVVTDNIVRGGATDSVRLDSFVPDEFPLVGTLVRGNLVRGAGVDGISVGTETGNDVPDAVIEDNEVSGAADDGFDVRDATATLTRNLATRNGDLGIEAAPGVTDGGGNRAFGNGNQAQCVSVLCAP